MSAAQPSVVSALSPSRTSYVFRLASRVLCTPQISITQSPSVRDAFTSEIVKLSPPSLAKWNLRGSENLLKFVLSPATSCPSLLHLDLSFCKNLEYILVRC